MHPDAVTLPSSGITGQGDLDQAISGLEQPPEARRGPMAEHGTGAARQHRGHPSSFPAQSGVSDGVNAAVDAMQTACGNPSLHRGGRDACLAELPIRDNPMLPGCDPRDQTVAAGAFLPHTGNKAPAVRVLHPIPFCFARLARAV